MARQVLDPVKSVSIIIGLEFREFDKVEFLKERWGFRLNSNQRHRITSAGFFRAKLQKHKCVRGLTLFGYNPDKGSKQ